MDFRITIGNKDMNYRPGIMMYGRNFKFIFLSFCDLQTTKYKEKRRVG
jgi:hypothetical protein